MGHEFKRLPVWGLMALMAATRFHHFGDLQTPPDASWAVFFLAGLFVPQSTFFALLFLEAALIDLLATTYGGVSDWCITPAYLFLVPTYGVLWFAGRICRRHDLDRTVGLIRTLAALTGAVGLAFAISNAGFYFLSGYFDHLPIQNYFRQVAGYFPSYLFTTSVYAGLVLAGRWLWRQRRVPISRPTG